MRKSADFFRSASKIPPNSTVLDTKEYDPYKMSINQEDTQILVIRLYFLLDALHVSDYISPSSEATL